LTLVVGLGCAWWIEHRRLVKAQSHFENANEFLEQEGWHHSGDGAIWARISAGKVWKPIKPGQP
jgi:hypothetical protein